MALFPPQMMLSGCRSGESHRPQTPILLKGIAIHLPFLSRYFCKSMPSSWQKVVYTPPICITIRLPFVSRYFCRSTRVRRRWDPPGSRGPTLRHERASKSTHRSDFGDDEINGGARAVLYLQRIMLCQVCPIHGSFL